MSQTPTTPTQTTPDPSAAPPSPAPAAFPNFQSAGMTLRDYFAAAALTGILSNTDLLTSIAAELKSNAFCYAYSMADAMLDHRIKPTR